MATGVLGLGNGQASKLNNELIDKLKNAERKSLINPIETNLENLVIEKETLSTIIDKANEFLESIKPFDLFVSGVNAFDKKKASSSGDSVVFDTDNEGALNIGTTTVEVLKLATRDVYGSKPLSVEPSVDKINKGMLNIKIAGTTYSFDSTNKTYEEFSNEINLNENFTSSIEEISTGKYRIVIRSAETGKYNRMYMSGNATTALKFPYNHFQTGQDSSIKVDGMKYDLPSNEFVTNNGLKVSAVKLGISSITIQKDTSSVEAGLQEFAGKYNELLALVDDELYKADSTIEDRSTLRTMMTGIKNHLFHSHGDNAEYNLFKIGFDLDKNGNLSLDTEEFNKIFKDDPQAVKNLFIGKAESEGLGTRLKVYVDSLDGLGGLLDVYDKNITSREKALEEQKNKAIASLDSRYKSLSQQFASYGTLINQFESSFNSLKLMIDQSSSN